MCFQLQPGQVRSSNLSQKQSGFPKSPAVEPSHVRRSAQNISTRNSSSSISLQNVGSRIIQEDLWFSGPQCLEPVLLEKPLVTPKPRIFQKSCHSIFGKPRSLVVFLLFVCALCLPNLAFQQPIVPSSFSYSGNNKFSKPHCLESVLLEKHQEDLRF